MTQIHKLLQVLQSVKDSDLEYDIDFIYTRYDYDTNKPYIDEDDAFLILEFQFIRADLQFHINGDIIACAWFNQDSPDVWIVENIDETIDRLKRAIRYEEM